MRKIINSLALLFFVWLIVDTFHLLDALVSFLLVGAIPGSDTNVSPTMMLAIMTTLFGIVVFELMARRFDVFRQIRYHLPNFMKKQERLPKRRFNRV